MRRNAVAALLAMAACAAAQQPVPPQIASANTRIVSGTVLSQSGGQPLSNATVTLRDSMSGAQVAQTSTDADGRFTFSNLRDGRFILTAMRRGFAPTGFQEHDGAFTAIVTGENLSTTGLELRMPPLASIYGTVTEDSGDPVPRAQIMLFHRAHIGGEDRMERANGAMADEMGNFEIGSLRPGVYVLCASGQPWYRPQRAFVNMPGAIENRPRSPLDVAYALTCYPETTDPAGADAITVRAGDRIEASVMMHPVPSLHITVPVQSSGPGQEFSMPMLRQQIFGFSDPVQTGGFMSSRNGGNENGITTMELSGVAPGQYSLEMRASGNMDTIAQSASVAVSSSDLTIDPSSLQPAASVHGTLTIADANTPRARHTVLLVSEQGEARESAPVDAAGKFQFRDAIPGSYELHVVGNGNNLPLTVTQLKVNGADASGTELKVGSEPIDLAITATRATGATVTGFATRNSKPAGGIFVLLAPADLTAGRSAWHPNQSDSDGSFIFLNIPPGKYKLVAIERGWTLNWRQAGVIDTFLAKGVDVNLTPDARTIDLKAPIEAQRIPQ